MSKAVLLLLGGAMRWRGQVLHHICVFAHASLQSFRLKPRHSMGETVNLKCERKVRVFSTDSEGSDWWRCSVVVSNPDIFPVWTALQMLSSA
jgi:hypothetical protein